MEKNMAKRVRKITPSFLKKVIMDEARKLQRETVSPGELTPIEKVNVEEVDADEYATALEKDLDHIKALKITERKLIQKIRQIREVKLKLRRRITRRI
jgi:hypothetical protein